MSRRAAFWLLVIIILGGTALRAYTLATRSIWFDEAFTWRLLQFPFFEMVSRAGTDTLPPLYYIVLRGWAWTFGSSLLALRSFSVVCAAASIGLAYLCTAAVASRRAGLLAAAFVALSLWQITIAWEARMYSWGVLLALTSSWLLLRAYPASGETRSPLRALASWSAYTLAAAAFTYTHYFAFFTLLVHTIATCSVIIIRTRGRIMEVIQERLAWQAGVSMVVILLIFSPWVPTLLRQMNQVQANFWIPPLSAWSLSDTFFGYVTHPSVPVVHTWPYGIATTLPMILIAAGGLALLWRSSRTSRVKISLIVLAALLPPILAAIISLGDRSVYEDRYLTFAQVFFLLGLAVAIDRIPKPALRRLTAGIVIMFFLVGYVAMHVILDIPHKEGTRAAAAFIAKQAPEDAIVVTSPFIFFPLDFHLQEVAGLKSQKLLSQSKDVIYFAGGSVIKPEEIVTPDVFTTTASQSMWVVDTTGFGGSETSPQLPWRRTSQERYSEVFPFQGEVIVSRWQR